jgi:hypothetical protein
MLGVANSAGCDLAATPEEAEYIVVNTCGFIGPAKEESVDTIPRDGAHEGGGPLREARGRRLPLAALPRRARQGDARGRPLPRVERHAQAGLGARGRRRANAGGQPRRLRAARERPAGALAGPAQRLPEDRRGLQPHLLVLRDPDDPRQAALARHRRHRRGGRPARVAGRARAQPGVAGHHRLRARPRGEAQPRGPGEAPGRGRGAALDPAALPLPRDAHRRARGAHRVAPQGGEVRGTCPCSTRATRCCAG